MIKTQESIKLRNLGKIVTGNTPKTDDIDNFDGEYPFVSPSDLNGRVIENTARNLSKKGMLQSRIVPPNSLLFCAIGGGIGKSSLTSQYSCFNQQIHAIIFDESKITYKFGNYYSGLISKEMQQNAVVSTVPIINKTNFGKIAIVVPSLEVQKQIVAFLDAETKTIDDSVSSMESLISLLTEKRAALISETVTRGVPGDHPEFKDSGVEWLGEIPEGWKLVKGKKVISTSKEIVGDKEDQYNRLSLTMRGVLPKAKDGAKGLSPDSFSTYQILRKNELVFKMIDLENRKTSRVGLSSHEGLVSSAYIVAKVDKTFAEKFAYYYYYSLYLQGIYNFLGSGVRSTLNADDMRNIPVVYPEKYEQEKIVLFIDKETEKIDTVINEAKKSIALLKEKRQTLISNVVTGKIKVNDEAR